MFFFKGRYTKAADLDSTVLYAAGGIYSSAEDLYKWIKAIPGQQILTPGSWKQAFTPNKGNYGFGWAIDSLYGKRYITHSGAITNFTSLVLYFPDEDISIILLNNTAGNLWDTGIDISQIMFDQPYPWGEQPEVKLDSAIMNQYTGAYAYDKSHTLFVSEKDGKLQLNGTITAIYARPELIQHSEIPAQLGCELTEKGAVKVDTSQKTTIYGVFACGDNSNSSRDIALAVSAGMVAGGACNSEIIQEEF